LQWTGLDWLMQKAGLMRVLPKSLRQMHAMLPELDRHYGRLPEILPAEGKRRARVALFLGCASDAFFPQTNLATARVLQRNGCEVWIPKQQGCCGALHYHAAQEQPAQQFAQANLAVFDIGSNDFDAIIVNAAGCAAQLKDYGHLLHGTPYEEAGKKLAAKVRDISEFLVGLGPVKPEHPLPIKAVYHDACHLCHAQQIRKQPRDLLGLIPKLEILPLPESEICCGAAGSYNITQPEMAARILDEKVANIIRSGAQVVVTGNPGCLIQIQSGLREKNQSTRVMHPIELLDQAYRPGVPHGPKP
jgi:glycolate oxidase iron-sulfur subunit